MCGNLYGSFVLRNKSKNIIYYSISIFFPPREVFFSYISMLKAKTGIQFNPFKFPHIGNSNILLYQTLQRGA